MNDNGESALYFAILVGAISPLFFFFIAAHHYITANDLGNLQELLRLLNFYRCIARIHNEDEDKTDALTNLRFVNIGLLDEDIAALIEALASHLKVAQQIKIIDLRFNLIKLSLDFTTLIKLEILSLRSNELAAPPIVTELRRLRKLDLANNQLKNAPNLAGLINLFEVDLSNNMIEIPPTLTGLTKLRKLILKNNQLKTIPALHESPIAKTLIFTGNPLTQVSKIMLEARRLLPGNQNARIEYDNQANQVSDETLLSQEILDDHFKTIANQGHISGNHKHIKTVAYSASCLPDELKSMISVC